MVLSFNPFYHIITSAECLGCIIYVLILAWPALVHGSGNGGHTECFFRQDGLCFFCRVHIICISIFVSVSFLHAMLVQRSINALSPRWVFLHSQLLPVIHRYQALVSFVDIEMIT